MTHRSFLPSRRSRVALVAFAAATAAAAVLLLSLLPPARSPLPPCRSFLIRQWTVWEPQRHTVLSWTTDARHLLRRLSRLLLPLDVPRVTTTRISQVFARRQHRTGGAGAGAAAERGGGPAPPPGGGGEGGRDDLHPAQNLLVAVTGDESRRSRMGGACRPLSAPPSCPAADADADADGTGGGAVEAMMGPPSPCGRADDDGGAAVEVRPRGEVEAVRERGRPGVDAAFGGADGAGGGLADDRDGVGGDEDDDDRDGDGDGEPFVGMMLQVLPIDYSADVGPIDDASKPAVIGGAPAVTTSRACVSRTDLGSTVGDVVQYELLELIKTHLGLAEGHKMDYMYKPVLGLPQGERGDDSSDQSSWGWDRRVALGRDSYGFVGKQKEPPRFPLWPPTWGRGAFDGEDRHEDRYEWMGDHAFAGGSHGEVWRARRRCPLHFDARAGDEKVDAGDSEPDFDGSRNETNEEHPCDDRQKLIMKRLKVEHGFDLMEAGLREVYFGELLLREAKAAPLFTKYVDHFFRELPGSSFPGSSSRKNVELWIVFEDAGPSLRSFLYSPVTSGDFVVYQHSPFWRRLRMGVASAGKGGSSSLAVVTAEQQKRPKWAGRQSTGHKSTINETVAEGQALIQEVLRQILTSADYLHRHGIVHRDIKPSNILCKVKRDPTFDRWDPFEREVTDVRCVLGDFSSAWDEFTSLNMYTKGPSAAEQTDEYAPPEVLFGPTWIPFDHEKPQSYDSWSIGVVVLEMLLGTPNVFSVDQRTTALLTNKMQKKGATEEETRRALYLAALSQFCIYIPNGKDKTMWPLRAGDPLHDAFMVKTTCTLQDFHSALRARDPLGLGFDSTSDPLLRLILALLAWDPKKRISASEALEHPFFKPQNARPSPRHDLVFGRHNALESQALDPRRDMNTSDPDITEFICPKCGKKFGDHNSCLLHARSRRHATFCSYDKTSLPPCLNAHSMLPAHPTSGYCDIQGRRRTIEDFHTVHLHPKHQFYGVFDGHNGNLASKYAASLFYDQLVERLEDLDDDVTNDIGWKDEVELEMTDAFRDLHEGILDAISQSPGGVMQTSGTTATVLFVTDKAVIIANVGDSRAILSNGQSMPAQLTIDHVASNEEERRRIENLGGYVSNVGGTDRINGTLAVSRSLGDKHLASLLSRLPHVVAMTKEDIREQCRRNFNEAEDHSQALPCFIVLASDGLWDVMSNQEVSDMVVQVLRKYDPSHGVSFEEGGAFQEAAEALTQEAYVRGSTDNIGVCVCSLL